MTQLAIAVVASLAIASLAFALRALTLGGAIAAFVSGAIVFGIGGWPGAVVLLAFFVSSSLLSRFGARRKRALADWGKQGARDAAQVFANGGIATLCVLFSRFAPATLALGFAAALSAATADTWATEIGTLSPRARSILTFRKVARGVSGGISLGGTLAQCAGACLIGVVAMEARVAPFWPIALGGIAGALFDSLLGASAQALRWCPACERSCETDPHVCGTPTTLQRGFSWLGNDAVNFLATLCGAVVAVLLARISALR